MSVTIINGIDLTTLEPAADITSGYYYLNTSYNTSSGANSAVLFDTIGTACPNLTYNASTGTFTATAKGIYNFTATVCYASNATGSRYCYYIINLQTAVSAENIQNAVAESAVISSLTSSLSIIMNIGDSITFNGLQTSTSTLAIVGLAANSSRFTQLNITSILIA